jgi:fucose 4-O-acetylase-like acetyltransferase
VIRDRYVDFLRALAICLVVLGHWLITALVRHDGTITAPEVLSAISWTQWLTLGFQIMPLFFLAGGHAAAGSWGRHLAGGGGMAPWIRRRALRLLLPTAMYAGLVMIGVAVATACGADPDTLALVGWALAMQFWFLPVYLLLSAFTPLLHTAHRRWGLRAPAAMALLAVLADLWLVALHLPYLSAANYLLVWGFAYQLGFCWHDGLLTRRRLPAGRRALPGPLLPAAMTVLGGAAFAALIVYGPFPASLVLVSTETVTNTNPPSIAMLAWACAQIGLCLLLAPAARAALRHEQLWRLVRPVGGASMTLYLWHMVPVIVAAALLYLTDLAPEPIVGSLHWWALRIPWVLVLAALLLAITAALRPIERALAGLYESCRPDAEVLHPVLLWLGLVTTVFALSIWATHGFAYGGHFPVLAEAAFAVGAALVGLRRPDPAPDAGADADRESQPA